MEYALFDASAGGVPPVLAGRIYEKQVLSARMDEILEGKPARRDVILHGPRGNGKTALLQWMERLGERRAKQRVSQKRPIFSALRITPKSHMQSPQAFGEALLNQSSWIALLKGIQKPKAIGVAGFMMELEGGARSLSLQQVLDTRLRQGPFLLLIDEAHTLPLDIGADLLNVSQILRKGKNLSFCLVLAGTPGLQRHLGRMEASFWERSDRLRVGRLEPQEAREALVKPLMARAIRIEPAALKSAEQGMCQYPYFVQALGESLVQALNNQGGAEMIGESVMERAERMFQTVKDEFYEERREELLRSRLAPLALHIGDVIERGGGSAKLEQVQWEAEQLLGPEAGLQSLDALYALGFIWRTSQGVEFGIPPLISHLRERRWSPPQPSAGANGNSA